MYKPTVMPATIPLNYDKIILLGDSLTEYSCQTNHGGPGLGPMIENAYMRKVDVLFRGYAGYNSDGAKYIVPRVLAAEHNQFTKVKLMIIILGSNDSGLSGPQSVPIDRFKKNIESIITECMSFGVKPLLVGPSLHDEELWQKSMNSRDPLEWAHSNATHRQFADASKSIANKYGIAFVDLQPAFLQYGGWKVGEEHLEGIENLLWDGVHYTSTAYGIAFEEIMNSIRLNYPDVAPEALSTKLSHWSGLNVNDLEATIFVDQPGQNIIE